MAKFAENTSVSVEKSRAVAGWVEGSQLGQTRQFGKISAAEWPVWKNQRGGMASLEKHKHDN